MSADPLLESLAKALWATMPDVASWDAIAENWRNEYRRLARAAHDHLREHDRRSPGLRQVDEAELVVGVRYRLSRMTATRRKTFASGSADTRRVAEQQIAEDIVRLALDRFEILSSAPVPENGYDLFTKAAFGPTPPLPDGPDRP